MNQLLSRLLPAGGLVLASLGPAAAQTPAPVSRHLVYFRDKAGTPFSVSQPQAFLSARSLARRARQGLAVRPRDLPVTPAYVAKVRAVAGAPEVRFTSRWLNAVLISCDAATLARVQALPEVSRAQTLSAAAPAKTAVKLMPAAPTKPSASPEHQTAATQGTRKQYGKPFGQNELLGAVAMHDAGFRGEGVHIAVFDAGFPGVNTAPAFRPLQTEGRLAGTRNFVDGGRNVFLRDSHGTNCLSTMAAEQTGYYIGTAPRATYHLCITEDGSSERPVEEANWLAAAEYADSAGVDIISSSLGYTTFEAPFPSYTYADLNGRTALSTRAAVEAARVGMLVVNSAGNEGNNAWHYVSAPADADSIISVGAVDSLGRAAAFSSVGPTADGRIKPTLVAQGVQTAVLAPSGTAFRGNGTSFAAPSLAGLAAGFWQANPRLTAQQLIQYLTRSASQAAAPDNSQGYGLPNFSAAQGAVLAAELPGAFSGISLYPNPADGSGTFRLHLPATYVNQPLQVRIYDARGALVRDQQLAAAAGNTRVLPVGVLAAGSYYCRVEAAGQAPAVVRFTQP